MSRMYVVQDWQNAAEYSGEIIGNRLKSSEQMFLPNGKANTKLFADSDSSLPKKKEIDHRPIEIRNIDKLDKAICVNYSNWKKGKISFDEYQAIDNVLQARHKKLVDRLTKLGYYSNQDEEQASSVAEKQEVPYVFDSAINEKLFPVYVYTMKQLFKFIWKIVRRILK